MGSEVGLPGLRSQLRSLGLCPGIFTVQQWADAISFLSQSHTPAYAFPPHVVPLPLGFSES